MRARCICIVFVVLLMPVVCFAMSSDVGDFQKNWSELSKDVDKINKYTAIHQNVKLESIKIENLDIDGVIFNGAFFEGVTFANVSSSKSDYRDVEFRNCKFIHCCPIVLNERQLSVT